ELAELLGKGRASGKDPAFAELTRRLGFEYNGMILHEYYFSKLRKAGERTPPTGSAVGQALGEAFGSVETWKADFQAMGDMRGIGWGSLFQGPRPPRGTHPPHTPHHAAGA